MRFVDAGPKIIRVGEKFHLQLNDTLVNNRSVKNVVWKISPAKSPVIRKWFTRTGQAIEGMKPGEATVRAYIKGCLVSKHDVQVINPVSAQLVRKYIKQAETVAKTPVEKAAVRLAQQILDLSGED